ncbi:hypothetical protein SLEP1_g52359 [Rubroshorea leprosula]|uniref:Uncharacterized protein n=1 Tax=Rubroshorea leprosula TaxID=152421 RepID=A0AAV5M613_9ROSI|nr:hypothetical protein SLEP1_g52359 [Rubroshorea leprosula]
MEAKLLGPLVDVTISKVISVTTEQLNLAVGFKQELKKFHVMLRTLGGVLQDAEQKKVTSYSDLQPWLEELGNIVDEADDVVDEIAYEHLRYKVAQMWEKVSYFFTLSNPLAFCLKIANRIKNLNLELADLNNGATGLGLQYRLASKHPEHIETQQTDSSISDPSKIVGRENKVLEVVQSLIDSSNDQCLLVVSIVGMEGIGKTTVAKLLLEMLQAFVENVSVDESQDIVVQKLQEHLREKNYLLILDYVWNEDRQKWESSRSCLLGIGTNVGSRVLVTTRSEKVASTMGTLSEHKHHLEKLTDEDCWSIIKKRAFVSSSFPPELERIGRDIGSKCRDSVMEKEMLMQLWMAEGFLQPLSERYMEMEDIGDRYFNSLSSYSLFQDAERDSYGSIIACKMHDLVHDLAQFVSKSQTLILEDGSGRNIPADIRHLNVISDKGTAATRFGDATKLLHTLFSQVDVFHSMSMNLRRFLDVSRTGIKELPKFITRLYQLQTFRFMDCWKINGPLEGIWDLVNLRHIYFNQWELMPAGIGRLTCLKTLQLFVVGQQKGHQIEELRCLSQLKGKLQIRNLDMVRGKEEAMGAGLSEKATIQELQLVFAKKHAFEELQSVLDVGYTDFIDNGLWWIKKFPSGLPSCTALEELAITNCDNLISIPDDLRRSWSIPNPACLACLKQLTIGGFSTELKEFPDPSFIGSHLEVLTLIAWGEPRERLLDQIQHLTALCLWINGCPELKRRWASGSGSEWDYISHIPLINIEGRWIQLKGDPIEYEDNEQQGDDNEQLPARATRLLVLQINLRAISL